MRTSVRLTLLPLVPLVSLLSGCAAFLPTQPSGQAGPSLANRSAGRGNAAESIRSIYITSITQTNSEMSFVFNQPIQTFHILSGDTALFLRKTNNSITFKRSPSANVVITVLVSTSNSGNKIVTLHVPQAAEPVAVPIAPSTNSSTSPSPSNQVPKHGAAVPAQPQSSNTTGKGIPLASSSTVTASSGSSNHSDPSQTSNTTKPVVPVHPGKAAPLVYFGPTTGRRIYITVDDGWQPSQRVLSLMQQQHVPITAFLIQNAAVEHLSYWKAFVAAGGVIQDHTVSHPWLSKVTFQQDLAQWQGPIQTFPKWFGQTPTLGRPPYGAVDQNVLVAAHNAGLQTVVMWSAEFNPNNTAAGLQTWNGKPLSPGEIVLLHWQPGLYNEIEKVLAICKQQHLVPAPLMLSLS